LGAFTAFESYSLAYLCNFTDPEIVVMALVGTCAITLSLVTYAMTTKKDFTMMGSFVF
jgi:FtsH-binding integral membrane protein